VRTVTLTDLYADGITDAEIDRVLDADIAFFERDVRFYLPQYDDLDPIRQRVCVDFAFNIGQESLGVHERDRGAEERGCRDVGGTEAALFHRLRVPHVAQPVVDAGWGRRWEAVRSRGSSRRDDANRCGLHTVGNNGVEMREANRQHDQSVVGVRGVLPDSQRECQRRYKASPKGRATQLRYYGTDKDRLRRARFRQTEKCRLIDAKYYSRPENREHKRWRMKSYRRALKLAASKI
jgi:hypothetical protein